MLDRSPSTATTHEVGMIRTRVKNRDVRLYVRVKPNYTPSKEIHFKDKDR